MDEIFDSAVRSSGDFAGVFEYDGDTSFFYLYQNEVDGNARVLDAIRIATGTPDFGADDIQITWDTSENIVGLFIRGNVWAVFQLTPRQKYDGVYGGNWPSKVPPDIVEKFTVVE